MSTTFEFVDKDLAFRGKSPLSDDEKRLIVQWEREGKAHNAGLTQMVLNHRKSGRSGPGRPRLDAPPVRGVGLGTWPRIEAEALVRGVGNCIMTGLVSATLGRRMMERLEAALTRRYGDNSTEENDPFTNL